MKSNLQEHKFIVFGEEHYNPLGIIRSLGENEIHPIAIILRSGYVLTSKSKYIATLHMVDSIEEGYKILLNCYGNEEKKPFIYTADDKITSYLDKHYDDLIEKFYFYNAGEANRIFYYMNKNNINQLAIKHNLNVLDSIAVNRGEIPDDLEYPVITKSIASTIGGWKEDVFICSDENELKKAYKKIQSPVVLLQKYIEKKNELCLDGFSADKGRKQFISIASSYNYTIPNTYSSYMSVSNFVDKELSAKIQAMMEEVRFEGIYSIEFLLDSKNQLYFCEINFRNSTWSYASTCAGMPLPILWAKEILTGKIDNDYIKKIPKNFMAMVEVGDFKERVLKRKMSIWKWLKDLNVCKCRFYLAKNDIKPVVLMTLTKLIKKTLP